jgi:hypothetical protein
MTEQEQFMGLLADPDFMRNMQREMALKNQDYYRMASEKYGGENLGTQLQGNVQSMQGGGFAGGGRIGTTIPITDEQRLILGLSGGGYRGKYGSDFQLQGADAMLQGNGQSLGVQYNRPNQYAPQIPRWMINYRKEF